MFLPLPCAKNMADRLMRPGAPWQHCPDPKKLAALRGIPKRSRRSVLSDPATDWLAYSGFEGMIPTEEISEQNPPARMLAVVVDYDRKTTVDEVKAKLADVPAERRPSFLEVTLSGNVRAIWPLPEPISTPGLSLAKVTLKEFLDALKVVDLLPGYDSCSEKPTQRWFSGGEYHETGAPGLQAPWCASLAIRAASSVDFRAEAEAIPLEVVATEIEARWPGRWNGPFELNATGPRFWDSAATNPRGCMVKADGMLVFSAGGGFRRWEDIFGQAWAESQRVLSLEKLTANVFTDEKNYWRLDESGQWMIEKLDRLERSFKARGVSNALRRGETISELGRALAYIESTRRVHGVAPLVNFPPGVWTNPHTGDQILNIARTRVIQPSVQLDATPAQFPFLSGWLGIEAMLKGETAGLILRGGLPYFLSWLRRGYLNGLHPSTAPTKGQAIFACGPRDGGKNLLCDLVLVPMLGGRSANPYDWMVGETEFSEDLFSSGFLAINDQEAPVGRHRETFAQRLKALVVNEFFTYRAMYCSRVSVPWCGRAYFSLNDQAKDVAFLAEINPNTKDKMMYFATGPYAGVFPARAELKETVARELPYFCRWLLNGYVAPAGIETPGRMGVESFHDPVVVAASRQHDPCYLFLDLLQSWADLTIDPEDESTLIWTGKVGRLYSDLEVVQSLTTQLRTNTPYKIGIYLETLSRVETPGITGSVLPGGKSPVYTIDKKLLLGK